MTDAYDNEEYPSAFSCGNPGYRIAYMKTDGSWDIVEAFDAESDAAANAHAEEHYGDTEWYVLDRNYRNINGGVDG
jgi:hypothetical protein